MTLRQGTFLQGGKYKIERFIASGGFGCTYEAHHTLLDLRVALKEFFVSDFCNRDEQTGQVTVGTQSKVGLYGKLKKKFLDEARALFNMKHPGIVRVIDVFEENGTAYYAMEYVDGQSLGDVVKERGKLPETEAVGYMLQVADALKYVHGLNRLHLDIKPGNIMLNKEGKTILIDFGASKHYDDETGENTSTLLGINTKGYAPVEQMNQSFKSFSPATDIYAIGATLYKLLTGITPPPSTLLHSEEATLSPLPPYISTSTRRAVEAAMQLLRKNRPQSVEEWESILTDDEKTTVDNVTLNSGLRPESTSEQESMPQSEPSPHTLGKRTSFSSLLQKRWKWIAAGLIAVAIVVLYVLQSANSTTHDIVIEKHTPSVTINRDINSQELKLIVDDITYNMIKIEAGTFTMGATPEQNNPYDDEKPTHQVTLTNNYYIGQTEVTQALWKAVMGGNPSRFKGDNRPVEIVNWNDCQKFIIKLNSLTDLKFRLPTEAEWEYAARGGKKSKGYQYSGSNNLNEVAWYYNNSNSQTHDVATKQPNELGVYDMSGNVCEWCQDWNGSYSSASQTNPTGATSGSRRVGRGGSWGNSSMGCRSSKRGSNPPDSPSSLLGLRLVLSE